MDADGLVVLELFAGIGGMRQAFSHLPGSSGAHRFVAVECSEPCRQTYHHNFADAPIDKMIERLSREWLDELAADVWTMSPPCQPFTTSLDARRLDEDDPRCAALRHLCEVLPQLARPPRHILLENVKGFLDSRMHERWLASLDSAGYTHHEYVVSPHRAGLSPNERTRYYCLAERSDRFAAHRTGEPETDLHADREARTPHTIGEIVGDAALADAQSGLDLALLAISRKDLSKPWAATALSIVGPNDRTSFCFTGQYGKGLNRACGSLYLPSKVHEGPLDDATRSSLAESVGGELRRFSPSELLRIFGFPRAFSFPAGLPLKARFKMVGNSINVGVVARLLRELLIGDGAMK
jgi:tRNA (cytosine38-C5)-methyltransferase